MVDNTSIEIAWVQISKPKSAHKKKRGEKDTSLSWVITVYFISLNFHQKGQTRQAGEDGDVEVEVEVEVEV